MGPAPVNVAFDVTPLIGFRTGIGLATAEMWAALVASGPGLYLHPYAVGVESGAASGTPGPLPAGTARIRLPTRLLLRVWSRSNRVSMDHWLRGADVVHATNYTVGPSRRPTLLTLQDIGFATDPSTADAVTATFPGMIRRSLERGAHVHVTTAYMAAQVEARFGPGLLESGRVSVVPLGVPALPPAGVAPPGVDAALRGRPYVLALGSQQPRKNLPVLIGAFGAVAVEVTDLHLVLAGPDGAGTPAVQAAINALSPAAAQRVVLAGPVTDRERVALLERASVLAYPSRYEGFGLPPLEAMLLGVPTLVSRAGALPEVAGPAAEMVDPDDVEGWADGLRRLVGDDARRRELIAAGRSHAAGFTWDITARGLRALYERLATSA